MYCRITGYDDFRGFYLHRESELPEISKRISPGAPEDFLGNA